MPKPKRVSEAIKEGNERLLSNMGRRGAKVAARKRAERIEEKFAVNEEAAEAARKLYSLSEDGDVLPPESDAT